MISLYSQFIAYKLQPRGSRHKELYQLYQTLQNTIATLPWSLCISSITLLAFLLLPGAINIHLI